MSRSQFLPAREHLPVKTGKLLADLSRLPPAHEAVQVTPGHMSCGGRGHSLTLTTVPTQRPDRSCPCRVVAGTREESRVLTTPPRAGDGFQG